MNRSFFIIIIILLIFVSCTERIDIDTEFGDDFPRYMVVEGFLSTDTTEHVVKLSWSKPLDNDEAPETISDALVTITGNGQTVSLNEKEDGIYCTPPDFYGVAGNVYHLTIDNVDVDEDGEPDQITATDTIIPGSPLDSITLEWIDPWEAWSVKIYAQEPGDQRNYYMFNAYINDTLITDTLYELTVTDDYLINGIYINGLDVYYFNEEDTDEVLYDGDTVTITLSSISQQAYEFIWQAQTESGYSAPLFSGPPSNVDNNMEGKNVFGFFMTHDITSAQAVWRDEYYQLRK